MAIPGLPVDSGAMTTTGADDIGAVQRRTLRVLVVSVAPAGMGMAGGFAATSLAAEDITGNDGWSTFAATMISIGGALAAVPLARHMATHGRRPGLRLGWSIASLGALLAFVAVEAAIYPLLVLGVLGVGVGQGTNLAARYASADLAEETKRARTIGILVWASSIGSVLGPTVALGPTGWLAEQVGLERLSGPYLMGLGVFGTAAFVVDRFLRPDPLLLATSLGDAVAPTHTRLADSFASIARHPQAAVAVGAMAVGQAVMVGIMTVTPLHMDDGAHETQIIGLVISLHIVGMYFFAPLVGWFVDRLPSAVFVGGAGVILFLGGELASHTDPEDSLGVFVGLFLVGVGWSFAMISGSALLTGAYAAHERAAVQGAADFTMVASGAAAGVASGVIVDATSYHFLSHWAAVAALGLVATALYPLVTRVGPKRPTPVSS